MENLVVQNVTISETHKGNGQQNQNTAGPIAGNDVDNMVDTTVL